MKIPQLVVAAGGLGTRMGDQFKEIPKILAPINSVPFLELQLEKFAREGVTKIHYLLGHRSEMVVDALQKSKLPLEITFTVDPPGLIGTGGALVNSLGVLEDRFLFTYGDSYLIHSVLEIWEMMKNINQPNIMCLTSILDSEASANASCSGGLVRAYNKGKNENGLELLDYGLILFDKNSLKRFNASNNVFDMSEIFTFLIQQGALYSLVVKLGYFDIGSPSRIRKLEEFLNGNL